MAIMKDLSQYDYTQFGLFWRMVQISLTDTYTKDVTNVYTVDGNDLSIVVKFTKTDDIEGSANSLVQANNYTDIEPAYYQYKNEILHLVFCDALLTPGAFMCFTATRLSSPIESLEDTIDIPNTLVPLFVQKVIANTYQLQGKEIPLSIQRKIKELE